MLNHKPDVLKTLDQMDKSPYEFHLTGSQYFIGYGQDTDYFVEYQPGIMLYLSGLGFTEFSESQYKDTQCKYVYRYTSGSFTIDVQIVKDAFLKSKVQDRLKKIGKLRPTTEDWNLAFALLA